MAVTFKATARLKGLPDDLVTILRACVTVSTEMPRYPVVVTSLNDSVHMTGSRHGQNLAVDLRVNDRPWAVAEEMRARLQALLPRPRYLVLLEGTPGDPNSHLHIEVD